MCLHWVLTEGKIGFGRWVNEGVDGAQRHGAKRPGREDNEFCSRTSLDHMYKVHCFVYIT